MRSRRLVGIRGIYRDRIPGFERGLGGLETFVASLEEVLVYSDVTQGGEVAVVEGGFAGGGGADE